jgi:hypothetical protein
MKLRIRPSDVMNQITSRITRAKNKEQEYKKKQFVPGNESKGFYKTYKDKIKNASKFTDPKHFFLSFLDSADLIFSMVDRLKRALSFRK